MHHLELGKASNSARLMACALARPALVLLGHPDMREAPTHERPLVLFPGANARRLTSADAGRTLLIPDGSWSQARKIHQRLIRNVDAEPVQVAQTPPVSTLRKSPGEGLLSTADALIAALTAVGDTSAATQLGAVLARFVAATFSTRGRRSQHWMPARRRASE
jgi:DTW domain-containing protein